MLIAHSIPIINLLSMKTAALLLVLTPAVCLHAQEQPVLYPDYSAKGVSDAAVSTYVNNSRQVYIEQYKQIAISEMERTGIPASIKLAQGILESNAGQSELAIGANNHFGIKCGGDWQGKSFKRIDDDRDQFGNPIESCFRKYEKAEESFFDHSEFLRDPRKYNRYGFLFNLDRRDYKGWAHGLRAAGYATDPVYANSLIEVIERYRLFEHDQAGQAPPMAGTNPNVPPPTGTGTMPAMTERRIGRVNDVKVVLSRSGETLSDIARQYAIKPEKIVDYNDRGFGPGEKLPNNERIFLQTKRNRYRGQSSQHLVKEGQAMFEIAQLYGIKLDALYSKNRMLPGREPATGERINLKRRRSSSDPVRLRNAGTGNDPSPQPTAPGSLTPADDTYLFDLREKSQPDTARTTTTLPVQPATTGVPFPSDPAPSTVVPEYPPVVQPTSVPKPTPIPGAVYHDVVKGDTLFSISRKYGTTIDRIKALNNMTSDAIQLGQQLRVK
jgi:LysM repeat protein